VTSLIKAAASQRVTGGSGGTGVLLRNTIGVAEDRDNVAVPNGKGVFVNDPWVDMAFNVCAADVYSALSVAAGWGVAAAKGAQARMLASARKGISAFLKYLLNIQFSIR
jgi:hypothetical protein